MKALGRWLTVMGVFFLLMVPVAQANKGDANAQKVAQYISQLKAGANPDTLKRPELRHLRGSLNKDLIKMMDEAEALARAGKRDRILEIKVVDESPRQQ